MNVLAMHNVKRAVAGVLGLVLLSDGLILVATGYFNLGVVLPLAMGLGLCGLGLWWTPLKRWLGTAPRRAALWRWFWYGVFVWLGTVAVFWTILATRASADLPATAPAAIVVLGSGSPGATASPTLVRPPPARTSPRSSARDPPFDVPVDRCTSWSSCHSTGRI